MSASTSSAVEGQAVAAKPRIRSYPMFLAVWAGQFLSAVGVQITGFALSIWVFQNTGSVTKFAMVVGAQLLPSILFASLAGVIVDRFDRRRVMLISKVGSAVVALAIYALLRRELLTPATIGIATAVAAVFAMVHQIAYAAAVPLLVPKPLFRKANGLVQLSIHVSAVVVPLIAVLLLEWLGLAPIILIECMCFVAAAVPLLIARFAPVPKSNTSASGGVRRMFADQADGLRYLGQQRGLIVLLVFVFFASFLNGFVYVLFRPMILTLADTAVLGTLVTVAGVGGLAGALFVSFFIKTQDRISPLLLASVISALSMILCGAVKSHWLIGAAAFAFSFAIPIVVVTAQTLWQSLVPIELQGRVFSTRTLFVSLATLLAVLASPLLAEHWAEPAMSANATLGRFMGAWIGAGPGRGMALLFIVAGLAMLLATAIASRNPHLLRLRHDKAESLATQS